MQMRKFSYATVIIAAFVALVGCGGGSATKVDSVRQYVGTWADIDCLQSGCGGAGIDFTVIENNGSLSIPAQPVDADVRGGYTFSKLDTSNGMLKFTQTYDGKADGGFCAVAYVLHRSGANLVGTYTYSCAAFSNGPNTTHPAEAGGPVNITFVPESGPGWRDGQ
jgi:hypothetical protein